MVKGYTAITVSSSMLPHVIPNQTINARLIRTRVSSSSHPISSLTWSRR